MWCYLDSRLPSDLERYAPISPLDVLRSRYWIIEHDALGTWCGSDSVGLNLTSLHIRQLAKVRVSLKLWTNLVVGTNTSREFCHLDIIQMSNFIGYFTVRIRRIKRFQKHFSASPLNRLHQVSCLYVITIPCNTTPQRQVIDDLCLTATVESRKFLSIHTTMANRFSAYETSWNHHDDDAGVHGRRIWFKDRMFSRNSQWDPGK